jgi:hypothetical protein
MARRRLDDEPEEEQDADELNWLEDEPDDEDEDWFEDEEQDDETDE